MATADNFMATDIKWDPTGSDIIGDGGWFAWRPRPPSLLSEQKEKEVKKDLRQSMERYEEEDEEVLDLLSRQEMEKRRVMEEEWEMWINKWKQLHEEEKLQTQNLLVREKKRKKSIIMRPLRS
ncbi:eukaryotic translation initiation factor 3 subunit B-like [Brassica napus]|uniref:eukaryotic translation initiation factor 3 subunit B-like n=1 Tax=Brassica napus TaxID=3708 RepID=UPI0020790FD1|nr:eukaryotic translation initiation factor 3 subunit B-like [Brassica napus]